MVSLNEQLLPEEVDVLARTAGSELDVSAMFVVQDVFRAAAALRTRLETGALQAEGLTWSSFTMLFCLWVWGPQETRELAERMGVSRPTVSGVTDTLERRGLVERRAHADDARRARSRSPPPASARSRSSSHASTPRSRWPAAASAPRSARSSPRSCARS